MAHIIEIEGVEDIKKAMKKTNTFLGDGARKGLIRGGLYLQRKSQEIVPIDTSNLENSAGTKAIGHGWYSDVVVYYTASYAVYVHERTELRHAPGKSAKFLEIPARRYRAKILMIISGEMARHMKYVRGFIGKKK